MVVEVLVHIAAPSSCADDKRYVAQAQNYLAYIRALGETDTGHEDGLVCNQHTHPENDLGASIDNTSSDRGVASSATWSSNRVAGHEGGHTVDDKTEEKDSGRNSAARERSAQIKDLTAPTDNSPVTSHDSSSPTSYLSVVAPKSKFTGPFPPSRKRSFDEFSSSLESLQESVSSVQQGQLTHPTCVTPALSTKSFQYDDINGDTTDIAIAIAELEERKAAEKLSSGKHLQGAKGYQTYERLKDEVVGSQQTGSIMQSSPCVAIGAAEGVPEELKLASTRRTLPISPLCTFTLQTSTATVETKKRKRDTPSKSIVRKERKGSNSKQNSFSNSKASPLPLPLLRTTPHNKPNATQTERSSIPNPMSKRLSISSSSTRSPTCSQSLPRPSTLPLIYTPINTQKPNITTTNANNTFVTPALNYLISNPLLLKHYNCSDKPKPNKSSSAKSNISSSSKYQTRPLHASERGYWLLNPSEPTPPPSSSSSSSKPSSTTPWSLALQSEFWTYLGRVIRAGRAGWGVWCVRSGRETNGTSPNTSQGSDHGEEFADDVSSTSKEDPADPSGANLGPIKVFCWGEVVPHVYLLLYVASRRALRTSEAKWIDVRGETVVRIGPGGR